MKKGFTLVELSIVLVIIGLLVGGILVGQSLISTAEKQRVMRNIEQIGIAVDLFEDRFRGLPGDMPNANNLFGASCGDGSCNGNGDGAIGGVVNPTGTVPANYSDRFLEETIAWNLLSLSGILKNDGASIEGSCNANGANGTCSYNVSNNNSFLDGNENQYTFCVPYHTGRNATDGETFFNGGYKWGISVAKQNHESSNQFNCWFSFASAGRNNTADSVNNWSNYNAVDMLEFDNKYDDGNARQGKVMVGYPWLKCGGSNAGGSDLDEYYTGFDTEDDCILVYRGGKL